MFSFIFILYILFLLSHGAFAAALIYHIRKYAVSEDPLHTFVTPFITLSLIGIILSAYFFLQVPWNTIL